MRRWPNRANGLAAYVRDAFSVTLWPLRRVLLAGAIGVVLSSAASWMVARYWEAKNAQAELAFSATKLISTASRRISNGRKPACRK
jgi:hypothetical protein